MHGNTAQEFVFKMMGRFDSGQVVSLLFIIPELWWSMFVLLIEVKCLPSSSVPLMFACRRKCDGQTANMIIRGNQVGARRYAPQDLQHSRWRRRWRKKSQHRMFKRRVLNHEKYFSQQQRKLCQAKCVRVMLRI